jgi:hypothetical protein
VNIYHFQFRRSSTHQTHQKGRNDEITDFL